MIASPKVREAFDLKKGTPSGAVWQILRESADGPTAGRSGVSVVTLKLGDYDTHEKNFIDLRVSFRSSTRASRLSSGYA
jgi:uncharacterized protein (DUF1501 family)